MSSINKCHRTDEIPSALELIISVQYCEKWFSINDVLTHYSLTHFQYVLCHKANYRYWQQNYIYISSLFVTLSGLTQTGNLNEPDTSLVFRIGILYRISFQESVVLLLLFSFLFIFSSYSFSFMEYIEQRYPANLLEYIFFLSWVW